MIRLSLGILFAAVPLSARKVDYDLTVSAEPVAPTGKTVRGLTINGSIPGPGLRFREGDLARITLRNGHGTVHHRGGAGGPAKGILCPRVVAHARHGCE